jgi:protein-S-isoprenylcysteine O-methyltransferase Ste14
VTAPETSGVRIFPPAIFATGIAAGLFLHWLLPVHLASPAWAPAIRWAGAALIAAWLALAIWAVQTFRGVGTTPNPTKPTTALAFRGPYRFTRNPMYLGFAFLQAGVAGAANSIWPLVVLPPVLWVTWTAVIRREERYLEEKFGAEYTAYKARVRRWL